MENKKHAPPRWCRIRRALVGPSPSATLARCTLGLRHSCPKCKGCTENVPEAMLEGFTAGLEEGKKNPLFWFDENGKIHARERTPEEQEGLALCRAIVERAFPGIYNEEDNP